MFYYCIISRKKKKNKVNFVSLHGSLSARGFNVLPLRARKTTLSVGQQTGTMRVPTIRVPNNNYRPARSLSVVFFSFRSFYYTPS